MLKQSRFNFKRTDKMTTGIYNIIIPTHKPEITILINTCTISREIPSIFKFTLVSFFISPVSSHHCRPAWFESDKSYFPRVFNRLISFSIENHCSNSRKWFSHRTGFYFHSRKISQHYRACLCLPI